MEKIPLNVVVASTSQQKIEPTKVVFRKGFLGKVYEATVTGVKAPSGINEQPIGEEETRLGAKNRLENARRLAPDADIWISMESGIRDITRRSKIRHEDFAVVIAMNQLSNIAVAYSAAVEFPDDAYQEAKRHGFATTTVGSVIAEMTGCDGTDPHSYLTKGKKPRKKLLEKAIYSALKGLPL